MIKIKTRGFTTISAVFIIIFLAILIIAIFYYYKFPEKGLPEITPPKTTGIKPQTHGDKASNSASSIPKSTSSKTLSTPASKNRIIIRQSGGSAMLIQECSNKNYLTEKSDYIIEGVVENLESKWNEQKTSIYTYTNIMIQKYLKGTPFEENKLQIITPGGEVEGIGQRVEDQPIFHLGKKVRIYFQNTNGEFSIVCAQAGVEEI